MGRLLFYLGTGTVMTSVILGGITNSISSETAWMMMAIGWMIWTIGLTVEVR